MTTDSRALSMQLRMAMQHENDSICRVFLPLDQLWLINPESATAELERCLPESKRLSIVDMVVAIFQSPPRIKIFAILTLIDMAESISPFLTEGISDNILPIKMESIPEPLYQCFASWPADKIDLFEVTQRSLLTPVLKSPSTMKDVGNSVFDSRTIMPFTNKNPEMRRGGFGTVFEVKIHPFHHKFETGGSEVRRR